MYMTFFDSKRYLSAEKFSKFYQTRKFFLSNAPEQEDRYEPLFQRQSTRYSLQLYAGHLEEHFEGIDGKVISFHHKRLPKETYSTYLKELLFFYNYAFGGAFKLPPPKDTEETLRDILLTDLHFAYEQDILVYRKEETEFYLYPKSFPSNNFVIRIYEKDDYEATKKEDLITTIRFLLTPYIVQ